nr:MAG TPA: hypothetical protein [Bacteriophage sp.]
MLFSYYFVTKLSNCCNFVNIFDLKCRFFQLFIIL